MSKFARGASAAKERSRSAQFAKTNYLSMKDQDEEILRFLTDAEYDEDFPHIGPIINVDQHNFVPTKSKPADFEGDNWPDKMGAVCRKTKLDDGTTLYDECYICDHIKKKEKGEEKQWPAPSRSWMLAVRREEVRATKDDVEKGDARKVGEVLGYRDRTREIAVTDDDGKPTGETRTEKDIVIVNQGYKNFVAPLQGFAGKYGTLLDRDYYIKRDGDDQDTTYHIVPLDPLDMPDPDDPEKTIRFDVRDPRVFKRYEADVPDLEKIVEDRASDEFYNRFFVPGEGSEEAPAKQSRDVPDEKVANLAERVRRVSPPDEGVDEGEKASAGSGAKALD